MFTTEKPAQHDAEAAVIEALHVAYDYWAETDTTHLVNQLAGHLFGTVKEGDFEEALEQYVALNSFDGEPLDSLARHYDEDEDPSLRLIRENEILQDLTAAINTILTNAGHKATTARRVNQLNEELNDTHRQVAA
jgi:hypothetical protein